MCENQNHLLFDFGSVTCNDLTSSSCRVGNHPLHQDVLFSSQPDQFSLLAVQKVALNETAYVSSHKL